MCLYSAYAKPHEVRKARVGETLTVGTYQNHTCLLGDDGKITCIKPGTQLKIDNLEFHKSINTYALKDFTGDVVTITLMKGFGRRFTADRFEMAGRILSIDWLAQGVTARIPRKTRSDKGTKKPRNLEKLLGMDQIRAPDAHTAEDVDDLARELATL